MSPDAAIAVTDLTRIVYLMVGVSLAEALAVWFLSGRLEDGCKECDHCRRAKRLRQIEKERREREWLHRHGMAQPPDDDPEDE